jgi:hypothetical protein
MENLKDRSSKIGLGGQLSPPDWFQAQVLELCLQDARDETTGPARRK